MSATATPTVSRRIAVFGSVAADRAAEREEQPFSAPARAVLDRVLEAVASGAPAIAGPIVDRAVAEGTITRDERHAMLRELSRPGGAGEEPEPPGSQGAGRTLREALAAVRRAAPTIARPILDEAVEAERLTPAQERRILERLRASPGRVLRSGGGTLRPRPAR
jgi:hypothetical protein